MQLENPVAFTKGSRLNVQSRVVEINLFIMSSIGPKAGFHLGLHGT